MALALRIFSLPGAGFVLPLLATRPKANAGNAIGEASTVRQSLSNRRNREAILNTLRSVVDRRGQKVCALDHLQVLADLPAQIIVGASDNVIPGVGHSPQVQSPETVAELIGNFVSESYGSSDLPTGAEQASVLASAA